jgi:glucose-6-phosphate isomerase
MKHFEINLELLEADILGPELGIDGKQVLRDSESEIKRLQSMLIRQEQDTVITYLNVYRDEQAIEAVLELSENLTDRFDNLLLIGIGGSSWGTIAIHTALNHTYHNEWGGRPRFYVLDNSDPEELEDLLEGLDLTRTCVNVVSKSGTTPETMANFTIVLEAMQKATPDHWQKQVVVTTDAAEPGSEGLLLQMADEFGFHKLLMPPGVGGRFSLLTAVGLFPAALLGIPVRRLLEGARDVSLETLSQNSSLINAVIVSRAFLRQHDRNIMVLMPYHRRLRYLSNWYMQLWAESLGKKYDRDGNIVHNGTTPLGALGAADQHSLNQLFMEGPPDKLITFLRVENFKHARPIPELVQKYKPVAWLAGHTLAELINAEQEATASALAGEQRGSRTIVLDRLTPESLGALFQFFAIETHIWGELDNVNPFDQPGVELGKVLTKKSLSG